MHASEKWKRSRSVVSNSQRPHGLQPTRLLRPWDFPGKSTGVGCHCLLPLVRWPRIKPGPSSVKEQSTNHWAPENPPKANSSSWPQQPQVPLDFTIFFLSIGPLLDNGLSLAAPCLCTKSLQSCPTPTLCDAMDWLLCPGNSPGKNAGVGCHALLQGVFPTQGLNPSLLSLWH